MPALVVVIIAMQTGIADLEAAMTAEFEQHTAAELLRSVPGLGPILAARVLAEVGNDPTRFATAQGLRAFAGTAPITKASGKSKVVRTRHVRNRRLADACHWWAFAAITKSLGARTHYDRRRAAGDSHNAALRNLANKLLGRLWWCLANDKPWDEEAAWPSRVGVPELARRLTPGWREVSTWCLQRSRHCWAPRTGQFEQGGGTTRCSK